MIKSLKQNIIKARQLLIHQRSCFITTMKYLVHEFKCVDQQFRLTVFHNNLTYILSWTKNFFQIIFEADSKLNKQYIQEIILSKNNHCFLLFKILSS